MKIHFILYTAAIILLLSCNQSGKDLANQSPVLLSDTANRASCVFLTKDENNNAVISWTEIDANENKHFYFANWNSKTNRFDDGVTIPIEPNTSIHEEGMPKIAFKGDGTIVAIYETSVPSEKSRFGLSDIQYVMSFDKGKTWTNHQSIQPNGAHIGSRSFGNIIRLDDGEIGIAWLDANPGNPTGGRPVMFARTSGKDGFGGAILIRSTACQCCRTALSSDGAGNISLVYRDLLSGSVRDISVSQSSDNGQSFSTPVPFSNDNWVIDGCPHNGPSVVNNESKTYVTWFTGSQHNGVFYAELDKNNRMLMKQQLDANGRFVQLCMMPDDTRIVAYNTHYKEGDSMYSKIMVVKKNDGGFFEEEASEPRTHGAFPVVEATGKNDIVIAWSDNGRVYYRPLNTRSVSLAKSIAATQPVFAKTLPALTSLSITTDPVCGMKINDKSVADTAHYKNKIVGFCSEGCKELFVKKPEAYLSEK